MRALNALSTVDIAWLAGLLEGEGSFGLVRNIVKGTIYRYPWVMIGMTDKDVICRVAKLFNCKVTGYQPKLAGRLYVYRATVNGGKAAQIMRLVLSHMGKRRAKKIRQTLAVWDHRISANELRATWSRSAAKSKHRDCMGKFVS